MQTIVWGIYVTDILKFTFYKCYGKDIFGTVLNQYQTKKNVFIIPGITELKYFSGVYSEPSQIYETKAF